MSKKDSELQGLIHLIMDATIGVTDLVESMHKQGIQPPFLPATTIQKSITKITSFTYNNIRWSTLFVGKKLHKIVSKLTPVIGNLKTSDKKEIILSVLNGVIGDYLEEKENPLKITMQFRYQAKAFTIDTKSIKQTYPKVNGKIILMVHGSCMSDIQWTHKNHNHGKTIAKDLQKTAVYLNYNSGKHVSTNGKELSLQLEKLVTKWPVPITELTILAHSMGGLVSRSAIYYGELQKNNWTKMLNKVVFLGTPHHGSHIERTGNYLDIILAATPYLKPFAKLAKIRSAGVTDLRYGNLVDEDWLHKDRFELKKDTRQHIPLSKNINFYSIAAVTGKETDSLSKQIFGDTLVDVKSALGQHKNPDKILRFKKENNWIAYQSNHLDLLNNPKIVDKLKEWLV